MEEPLQETMHGRFATGKLLVKSSEIALDVIGSNHAWSYNISSCLK